MQLANLHEHIPQSSASQMLREIWELALVPPPGHVILRAEHDPEIDGGLYTPSTEDVYPQVGTVIASSAKKETIDLGVLAVIQVESADIARDYYRVFEVCFKDGTNMLCGTDQADPIIDAFRHYTRTGEKLRIRLLDLSGVSIQFETDDILTYQFADMSDPGWSLLYPQKVRMFRYHPNLYYLVHEEDILCLLKL